MNVFSAQFRSICDFHHFNISKSGSFKSYFDYKLYIRYLLYNGNNVHKLKHSTIRRNSNSTVLAAVTTNP